MFCGFVRDTTQQQLDREKMRRQEAVIGQKFFEMSPEDSKSAIKRYPARYKAA
jgi:hypothetical protein